MMIITTTKANNNYIRGSNGVEYPKDLVGFKFYRLTVVKRVPKPDHLKKISSYWMCKCDCGNEKVLARTHLVTGHTKSCGCFLKELAMEKLKGLSDKNKTHGMSGTNFYEVWKKMKHRCSNKNNKNYHNYGGRGISVCEEWELFEHFKDDMYEGCLEFNRRNGENTATIERLDVNGDYCKSNCTWVTHADQQLNKRNNKEE